MYKEQAARNGELAWALRDSGRQKVDLQARIAASVADTVPSAKQLDEIYYL